MFECQTISRIHFVKSIFYVPLIKKWKKEFRHKVEVCRNYREQQFLEVNCDLDHTPLSLRYDSHFISTNFSVAGIFLVPPRTFSTILPRCSI